ncbi:MAG: energy transducer TonB [Sphingomonas bacterium]|nr:energy transducer TonB [Sphingomonas bacterium]
MLAYAPRPGRSVSRRTLLLVAAGHVILIGLVLTARSELPVGRIFDPTDIIFIDPPKPPPPQPSPPRSPTESTIDRPVTIIPTLRPLPTPLDDGPAIPQPSPFAGNSVDPVPLPLPAPTPPAVVRKAARFVTPASDVRPPYPAAKQRMGEEASLRLALQIDSSGRVISVDPVGAADPIFLDAARRHILKRWRYAPATEGDTAIASRIVITLRFELQ